MGIKAVSVSQVNGYIKRILATDPILCNVSVKGEIANLTKHSSGHWYFSLKDENSVLRCFLPSSRVPHLRFALEEGMQITASGSISVFERGGSYSLNIRDVDVEGEGDLKKAFDLLVKKLSSEGLFDEEHKKEIPAFPKKIGVVTSPTGAAIHDIITTIQRRNPLVSILLYPCLVQGPDAAESIQDGIRYFNKEHKDFDVLIVGRGGGSAEDLWAFNEEKTARAIYQSDIPIISAVGHEVDVTIADYVADIRAATPTGAAELAAKDLAQYKSAIARNNPAHVYQMLLDHVENQERHIHHVKEILDSGMTNYLQRLEHHMRELQLDMEGFNPFRQLEKGYAIVKTNEKWISSISDINEANHLVLLLKDGQIDVVVEAVHGKENEL